MSVANKTFFEDYALNKNKVENIINSSLGKMDDGELFLEYCESESLVLDEGNIKTSAYDTSQGFGLRGIMGEATAYAHSSILSEESLQKAASQISVLNSSAKTFKQGVSPAKSQKAMYRDINPLQEYEFSQKIKILKDIDNYLRKKDSRVKQVSVSLAGEFQLIHIMKPSGFEAPDLRPLVRLNISVIVEHKGRKEHGSQGIGGRMAYSAYTDENSWKYAADEALREALVNLESKSSPAGEMDVVLGSGWPGILLHEAVGHGLEGDFNRKKTSAFHDLMGQQVAAKGVTVIDNGTIENRRGSLTIDDEGTPTKENVLIEDGVLVGFMQDRLNARLMGKAPTGNGRRESYQYPVLPRMTNTYMLNGTQTQEELISRVKNGIFAVSFGGGQVDITSGKFVFSANEAYKIENGKIKYPLTGATLIGNGPECLKKVKGIANDMQLDPGVGTCGKEGQGVPVGVGQPSLLIGGLTVGGTEF